MTERMYSETEVRELMRSAYHEGIGPTRTATRENVECMTKRLLTDHGRRYSRIDDAGGVMPVFDPNLQRELEALQRAAQHATTSEATPIRQDECQCGHSKAQHEGKPEKGWNGECMAWHCGCTAFRPTPEATGEAYGFDQGDDPCQQD